jgi:hypothetical protein
MIAEHLEETSDLERLFSFSLANWSEFWFFSVVARGKIIADQVV